MIRLNCPCCKKDFEIPRYRYNANIKKNRESFCSRSCASKYTYKPKTTTYVDLICSSCGKEYKITQGRYKQALKISFKYGNCCSKSCAGNVRGDVFLYYVSKAKNGSKIRNHKDFNITAHYLKELWDRQNGICSLTGIPLIHNTVNTRSSKKRKTTLDTASLDRIDGSKGYVEGNVQFVCLGANFAKNRFSDEDAIRFFEMVVDNYKKQGTTEVY